ncbi:MAG: hypothetical protein BroJett003_19890 [Planctomycetota bacterium]|nr:MAG: hypothetical protein BroJett003_19890 [Planctomycetota bacterium]
MDCGCGGVRDPAGGGRSGRTETDAALGPTAVVSDFLHDFGTVTAGPVLEHTFVVANTGDEPLVITRFNAACGGASLTDVPAPIAPGQGSVTTGDVDPSGASGRIS